MFLTWHIGGEVWHIEFPFTLLQTFDMVFGTSAQHVSGEVIACVKPTIPSVAIVVQSDHNAVCGKYNFQTFW